MTTAMEIHLVQMNNTANKKGKKTTENNIKQTKKQKPQRLFFGKT